MGMREDYQALMEKQLNEWKAQAEKFRADAEQAQAAAKVQYETFLASMQAKQAEAWDNFHKLKGANEGAWTQFKVHMDKAGDEMKSAFEQFTTRFK
jgi:hypothetical protein